MEQIETTQRTILVADDNQSVVMILERVLKHEGYAVITAGDGLEALEKAFAHRPDVILLDIVMPILDGYEVCRRLHAHADTTKIPVVFLTVKGQVNALPSDLKDRQILEGRIQERLDGFDAGAIDFLCKPIIAKDVIARVNKIVRVLSPRDTRRAQS